MSAITNVLAKITGRQASQSEAEAMVAALLPFQGRTPPERGVTGMLDAYSKSPWLRSITSKIARGVGAVTWQMYATKSVASGKYRKNYELQDRGIERSAFRRKEVDVAEGTELVPIFDHPMLRLLNTGAGQFPGSTGRMLTQLYLELTGEAFWLLETQGGVPVGYWIIPPTWVQETPTPGQDNYIIEANRQSLEVPRDFMLWFSDPNPATPYRRGTGQMRTLGDEIDTDDYAAKYTRAFFYNNAQPNILVSASGMKKEDADRFELRWTQRLRGFLNAHRPMFLNRDVKVTQLSQKFSEMQFIELRKFERDMLINARGIPPEVFGVIENSNRATIDAADYLFAKHVLTPALEFLRSYLQSELVPRYDDRFILGYASPIEEDREFYLEAAKVAPWSLTLNEWRGMAGQDAVDYGDVHVFKLAEEARSPDMIGQMSVEEPPVKEPDEGEKPLTFPTEGERSLLEAAKDHFSCACCDTPPGFEAPVDRPRFGTSANGHGERWRVVHDDSEDTVRKQIGGEPMARLAEKVGPRMAEEIVIAFNDLRGSIDMNALLAALEAGDVVAANRVLSAADIEDALEPARQVLREAVIVVGQTAALELADALGVDFSFEMVSEAVIQELEMFGAGMVTNLIEGQMEAINLAIVEGYKNGLAPSEIAKKIRDSIGLTRPQIDQMYRLYGAWVEEFGTAKADEMLVKWALKKMRDRADNITYNELAYAANRGQEMVWEAAVRHGLLDPSRTERQWETNPDACSVCAPLNGQRAKIGEPYPSGQFTPNEIHIMCRCFETLVFGPA